MPESPESILSHHYLTQWKTYRTQTMNHISIGFHPLPHIPEIHFKVGLALGTGIFRSP